jgi:hypothetical protein
LRFRQFACFQPTRLAQFDLIFEVEHSFTTAVADMDMNWAMLVAVKREFVSILLKNLWHWLGA